MCITPEAQECLSQNLEPGAPTIELHPYLKKKKIVCVMWKESWSVFSVADNLHKIQLAKQRWGNAYKIKTILKHLLIEKKYLNKKLALVLSLCRWYCFSRRSTWSRWTSRPYRVARYPRSRWTQRLVQLVMFDQNESFSSPSSSLILYFPETVIPNSRQSQMASFPKGLPNSIYFTGNQSFI